MRSRGQARDVAGDGYLDLAHATASVFSCHARNVTLKLVREMNEDRLATIPAFGHPSLPIEWGCTAIRRYGPLQPPAAPYIENIYQGGKVENYFL